MSPRNKELSEQMREEARTALLAAARKLFADQGYFKSKVSDVARAAGMSQGNVYWYFSRKEKLLKAVLVDGFDMLGEILVEAAAMPVDGRQKLTHLLEQYHKFGQERFEWVSIMLSMLGHGGDAFFAELGIDMEQIGMGYTQSLMQILSQAQAEGIIAAEHDPLTLSMLFFGLFNGLNLTYGQQWLALPAEVIRDAAFRLLGVDIVNRNE